MKRLVLVIVGIIMVSSMVFAGGGSQAALPTNPYYPIEISVFRDAAGSPRPTASNKMYRFIQDRLGVTFNWDILVGDRTQRRGTMVAGGLFPDILDINETFFIDQGATIPLEGLIEQYGPRIKAHYADAWNMMKSPDGHIYHLIDYGVIHGVEQSPNYNGSAFWVQKAVLKDAGYPKIATVDQFFSMISNYYRNNPSIGGQPTIPFTILTYDWRAFELWNPPNFLAGYPNEGNGIVNPTTHEYKNFFTNDISKRWFRMLNEFDKQGLIDRTSFTDNHDQYLAKIAAGRVLGLFGQQWQFDTAEAAKTDRNEHIRTMAPLPIVFDANIAPRYRTESYPNIGRGLGISVSAKDPVRIIRFLNDYLAEDIQRTIWWGIEGEDWQYNAQRVPYRTDQQRANWDSRTWRDANRAELWAGMAPKIEGSFSDGYPTDLGFYYPEREAMLRPEDRELFNAYGVGGYAQMMAAEPLKNSIWFPTWSMPNAPDGSPAQIALSRCEETMKRLLPQMILAPTAQFDSLWDAYIREMTVTNNIGVYEQYMQQQLNQRIRERS
ncbi:MAG: extracellular solute-binding protein [Treponema sp.]|nr:extracellular solute-binding protein [Treponema sp.]